MKRTQLLTLLAFLAIYLIQISCKKDEDDNNPIPGKEIIIKEDVTVIDTVLSKLISDTTQLQQGIYVLSYTGTPPSFKIGDVIVGQQGEGYMRKVTQVNINGNEVVLHTSQARLTDVIEECFIQDSTKLTFSKGSGGFGGGKQPVEIVHLAEGVTIETPKSGKGKVLNLNSLKLFNNTELTATVTEGSIEFDPIINRKLEIKQGNIDELKFSVEGNLELNYNIKLQSTQNIKKSAEVEVGLFKYYFWIGLVPMIAELSVKIGFDVDMNLIGTYEIGFDASVSHECGAEYKSNQWTEIWEKNSTFNMHPLEWNYGGTVETKEWVTPSIAFRVAGIPGPYIEAQTYIRDEAIINSNQWQYKLLGGLAGNVGFSIGGSDGVFSYTVADFNKTFATWEKTIYSNSGTLVPIVTTTNAANITSNSANTGGNVTSDCGSAVTSRGVCWSTAPNPTIANNPTNNGTGTGVYTSNITGLNPSTKYYIRAYATNNFGTAYGNQVNFTTADSITNIPCPGMPTVTDYNGNVYNTVQIGTQCWMKENLRARNYRDGTPIPLVSDNWVWTTYSYGARCWYNNDSATYAATYGALYNRKAVVNAVYHLCPSGWHSPSDSEWAILSNFLGSGSVAGGHLKQTGTSHWKSPNTGATNSSGFTALPGGCRLYGNGNFQQIGEVCIFWSSTWTSTNPYAWVMGYLNGSTNHVEIDPEYGFSVRCVRD